MALGKIEVISDVQLGLVSPPNCRTCGAKMTAFNDHCWACTNEACRCYGVGRIVGGVYPIKAAPLETAGESAKKRGEGRDGQ